MDRKTKTSGTVTSLTKEVQPTPEFSNGDLGTIQALLFGEQWEADNKRLTSITKQFDTSLQTLESRLEKNLRQEISTLSSTLDKRLLALEKQIADSTKEQRDQMNTVNQLVLSNDQAMIARLNDVTDEGARHQTQLEETAKNLQDSVQSTRVDLNTKLENTANQLNAQKIDRKSMSKVLAELALQLEDQSDTSDANR